MQETVQQRARCSRCGDWSEANLVWGHGCVLCSPAQKIPDEIPPQAVEMERAALGACLLDVDALETVLSILKPDDFHWWENGTIYSACAAIAKRGGKVDLLTVSEELKARKMFEAAGGSPYLYSLTDALATAANAEHYARVVEEKSIQRKLLKASAAVAMIAHDDGIETAGARIAKAEEVLLGITRSDTRRKSKTLAELASASIDALDERYERKGQPAGLLTGISKLDHTTQGFKPTELVVVGARTSMGKTSAAVGYALHIAKSGAPVAYFSLEMDQQSIVDRVIAMDARVNLQAVRSGEMTEWEWRSVGATHQKFDGWPLHVDDNSQSLATLRQAVRRHVLRDGVKAVFIDHLGLIRYEGKHRNMVHMIGEITAACKEMAKEFQIPVVLLVQLSRSPESRTGHEPTLADLRDSGTIEQDADLVILIHRAGYYKPQDAEVQGKAKMIVAKHRNGPTGFVNVAWVKHLAMFDNLAEGEAA